MSGIDIEHTTADSIRRWAEYLDILLGVVRDSSLVLFIVCVTVQSDTDNFGLEVWWELGDGVENDSSSLTVFILSVFHANISKLSDHGPEPSCHNGGLRAFLSSGLDVLGSLSNSRGSCACWGHIVHQTSRVCRAAHALACDIIVEDGLQTLAKTWPNTVRCALQQISHISGFSFPTNSPYFQLQWKL